MGLPMGFMSCKTLFTEAERQSLPGQPNSLSILLRSQMSTSVGTMSMPSDFRRSESKINNAVKEKV